MLQPLSRNQRPDLLTSLMNMSLVLRLPGEKHLCRFSSNVPRLPSFLEMPQNPNVLLILTRWRIPCACHTKRRFNVQKWREHVMFCTFRLRNVLRDNGVHYFEHLNFQKCSEAEVFCTFWLRNVLRATTACTFSTSQLPKVVRSWCALYILTSKCASHHNGVHFFDISTSKSAPKLNRFVHFDLDMWFAPQRRATFHLWPHGSAPAALASLLFDHPEPQIIGKRRWIATFQSFRAPASSVFWLFLFSDLLSSALLFSHSSILFPPLLFHLSILSEVWLLKFPRQSSTGKYLVQTLYL